MCSPRSSDRRAFLRSVGLAGLGLTGLARVPGLWADEITALSGTAGPVPRRLLGRTGLMVSTLGLHFADRIPTDVIDYAIDVGVNYLDTARRYRAGLAEAELAPILARRRDEVIVASKWRRGRSTQTPEQILGVLDQSLSALGVEHLDVWLAESLTDPDQARDEAWLDAAARAKEQGKARFVGVTAWDERVPEILIAAAETGVHDVAHVRYHPDHLSVAQSAVEAAEMGVIGKYVISWARDTALADVETPDGRRAAVREALRDERIAGALVGAPTLDDVRLYATAAAEAGGVA